MDSRSFWFGAALALALLLFWRERKQIENALGLEGRGHGAGAGTGSEGGAGSSCCEKCAGDTAILPISPVEAPLAPNYSAPAHYVIGSVAQPARTTSPINRLDSVSRFF